MNSPYGIDGNTCVLAYQLIFVFVSPGNGSSFAIFQNGRKSQIGFGAVQPENAVQLLFSLPIPFRSAIFIFYGTFINKLYACK